MTHHGPLNGARSIRKRGLLSLLAASAVLIGSASAASAGEDGSPVADSPAPAPATTAPATDTASLQDPATTTQDPATAVQDPAAVPDADVLRYRDLAAQWWQWAGPKPTATNPMTDVTGDQCAVDQTATVWFLAPVLGGGTAERKCTVPARTKLFFPIVNSATCAIPGETPTLKEQRRLVRPDIAGITETSVVVDGVPLPELKIRYTKSVPFALRDLPADNVLDLPEGSYDSCADVGFYAMVPALSPSTKLQPSHTVHVTAMEGDKTVQDVTYTITVPKPKKG
jgi:hypothetical protein